MSRTTNAILEKEWEEQRKKAALLDLPDSIEENIQLVEDLKRKVSNLQTEIDKNNSFKEKYKSYFIGGIIGAMISTLLAFII